MRKTAICAAVLFLLLLLGAWANIQVSKNQLEYLKPKVDRYPFNQYHAQYVKGYEGSYMSFQPREYVRIGIRVDLKQD